MIIRMLYKRKLIKIFLFWYVLVGIYNEVTLVLL